MPKAYSYIRMSTEAQAVRGESLRRQLKLSQDYALERNLDLDTRTYQDLGVSAFTGDQIDSGALGKFIAAVRSGEIQAGSYLLVESLDRLSRERVFTALDQFLDILKAGIVIVTLSDRIEYSKESMNSSPSGYIPLLVSLSIMSRAHNESDTKSQRLKAAWQEKRARLGQMKATANAPLWLRLKADRKSFEVIEERQALVRRMFEDSKNGIGLDTIARRLNQAKVAPWGRSVGWQTSYVKKILENRATLGQFQPHVTENGVKKALDPIPGYYPRIISDELFFAAQLARKERWRKGGRKGGDYANLFSGLLKCGHCGRSIRFINKGPKPKGGTYLLCESANRGHNCDAIAWPYPHFETNFLTLVRELDVGVLVEATSERQILEQMLAKRVAERALLESCEAQIENLAESISRIRGAAQDPLVAKLEAVTLERNKRRVILEQITATIEDQSSRVQSIAKHQAQSVNLIDRMKSLNGDDLFNIRSKLAQLLRSTVTQISLHTKTPGRDLESVYADLLKAGFGAEQIAAYRASLEAAQPLPREKARVYVVQFRSGHSRTIKPHADDPKHYEIVLTDAPGEERVKHGDELNIDVEEFLRQAESGT